jgi:hypothetical protein
LKYLSALPLLLLILCATISASAQSTDATISGVVVDSTGKVIPGAGIEIVNDATGVQYSSETNGTGIYTASILPPGQYRIQVSKVGFKTLIKPGIILNVQSAMSLNFTLPVGAASESITVEAGSSTINSTDGSVSTVIDQKFVENIPLNGRSFQDLILLSPGVITNSPQSTSNLGVSGEFSVNGQRTESNYYTVDGVSANDGATSIVGGAALSGSLPASTALGTTQGLVSADALQEFRVESSTYSAQYGRNPGGQFVMVTRSGTNDWHGSAFDYLRNDALDANSWFNDNTAPITPKSAERQNDFGGTLGGRILIPHLYDGRDKDFFFVSYEGLRLVQPQDVSVNYVPDATLRQTAPAALAAVLDAFPLPSPGGQDLGDGLAEYIAGWSNPDNLSSTSVRFDHTIGSSSHLFFRFSDTPSESTTRGTSAITAAGLGRSSPSSVTSSLYGAQTYTGGLTTTFHAYSANDLRVNLSTSNASSASTLDSFGGAHPINLAEMQGIAPDATAFNVLVSFTIGAHAPGVNGSKASGTQKQWNLVDTLSTQLGRHQLKIGVDWRRLSPIASPDNQAAYYSYSSDASVVANAVDFGYGASRSPAYPIYKNLSLFLQDEWRVTSRLNLSMGLRWEVDPAPTVASGLTPYTVIGLNDLASVQLAPQGTPLWNTSWQNLAPRLGIAYIANPKSGRETIFRGGGGVFFDTAQQTGSYGFDGPGFSAYNYFGTEEGVAAGFPVAPSVVNPPIVNPPAAPYDLVYANPPNLQLPYAFQWNMSMEQALGTSQSFTLSYVGSNGRRLLEEAAISGPPLNPEFYNLYVFRNGLTSSYNSLQAKFQRQLAHGLQLLASYTWAHALDFGSFNEASPYQHGNSDLDIRHNLVGAMSYDLPSSGRSLFPHLLFEQWGFDARWTARTGFPVTLSGNELTDPATGSLYYGNLNLVSGEPTYLFGPQYPGGRSINIAAFSLPLDGENGDAPRNFVRGFGAVQTDIAIRRQFAIFRGLHGQFRGEAFNIFNHPNFGAINPYYYVGNAGFGEATSSLAQSLGVLNPLYQMGGPRSLQLALRLTF